MREALTGLGALFVVWVSVLLLIAWWAANHNDFGDGGPR